MFDDSQYIELTSANRDRVKYPFPSQFVLELSYSGRSNMAESSKDPIYTSAVQYPPNTQGNYNNFGYMFGANIYGSSTPTTIGLLPTYKYNQSELEMIPFLPNYTGNFLELIQDTTTSTSNEYREIVSMGPNIISIASGTITSFTTQSLVISTSFICDIPNILVGWTLTFTQTSDANLRGVTRKIVYFRIVDNRVFLDQPILNATITTGDVFTIEAPALIITVNEPFSAGSLRTITNNLSVTHHTTYRIHSGLIPPINQGTLVSSTQTTFTLPPSAGSLNYIGNLLWIEDSPVIYSAGFTATGFISNGTFQTQGTFTLANSASTFSTHSLEGMIITLTSGSFSGNTYYISQWNQSTLSGTVTPGWTNLIAGTTNPNISDTFTIVASNPAQFRQIISYNPTTRVGTVSAPFTYTLNTGVNVKYSPIGSYQILQFKRDNYQPLNYTETAIQQARCYEIELISLTLPNVPLQSGRSITYYPYVYIEFKSVTQGTSAFNFITNNPVVTKNIMFRAPIIYNYNLDNAAFLTVDGHGMIQTLKFKLNDSFQFSVYLPDGSLFLTEPDYFSPSEPNPALQITACFRLQKVQECKKQ
jgi:hypothetical protein